MRVRNGATRHGRRWLRRPPVRWPPLRRPPVRWPPLRRPPVRWPPLRRPPVRWPPLGSPPLRPVRLALPRVIASFQRAPFGRGAHPTVVGDTVPPIGGTVAADPPPRSTP